MTKSGIPAYGKRVQSVNSQIRWEIRGQHLKKARLFNYVWFNRWFYVLSCDQIFHMEREIVTLLEKANFIWGEWSRDKSRNTSFFQTLAQVKTETVHHLPMKKLMLWQDKCVWRGKWSNFTLHIKYGRIIISALDSELFSHLIRFHSVLNSVWLLVCGFASTTKMKVLRFEKQNNATTTNKIEIRTSRLHICCSELSAACSFSSCVHLRASWYFYDLVRLKSTYKRFFLGGGWQILFEYNDICNSRTKRQLERGRKRWRESERKSKRTKKR